MKTNYLILLPPSEGKNKGGDENKPYRMVQNLKKFNEFIFLNKDRELIQEELKKIISLADDTKDLEKIFDLKGEKLQEAIEITSDLLNEETMPAIKRYDGIMFKAIDYNNLNNLQKENFNFSVLFIDGMFGLLKPQDLIPKYKLKITSKVENINIIKFWKESLRSIFKILFKDKLVIDILPQSHRKVLSDEENYNIISINFCELKNNKLVNVGHESKKLKGDLIKYIISKKNILFEDFKIFKHKDGFNFSEKYSTKNQIVYLK